MPTSIILVLLSFVWLIAALLLRKQHHVHITMMLLLLVFDIFFPIYLYLTHDWYGRLIEHKEMLSFAVWAHLILVISLYAMYVLQFLSGKSMRQQPDEERHAHQMQARAFVVIRVFVFISGALLLEPELATQSVGG